MFERARPRIGAEKTDMSTARAARAGRGSCVDFGDRGWVERSKGWPPALLDMLSDFLNVGK